MPNLSSKFIIGLLNSSLIFDYYREFVNCTVNIQINDIRQIPVIIPGSENIRNIDDLVDKAIKIKRTALEQGADAEYIDTDLLLVEHKIDNAVLSLYRIDF